MSASVNTVFLAFGTLTLIILGACSNQSGNEKLIRLEKASEVIAYMNLSADPCQDFYSFACGNWDNQHGAILHKNRITNVEHHMETRINKDIHHLLGEGPKNNDNPNVIKVKEFYRSCSTAVSTSPQQHSFLVNFIKKNGGLPSGSHWQNNYNWLQTIANLRADYGIEILIGLQIDINPQNLMGQKIFFTEPKTTILPVDLCSKVAVHQANLHERDYETFQNEISRNLQKWISLKPADANRLAGEVIAFEFKLCKHMRKEHALRPNSNINENHNDYQQNKRGFTASTPYRTGQNRLHGTKQANGDLFLTLHQLNDYFGNKIDFRNFTETIFNTTITDRVFLRSESYFNNLALLVQNQSKNTLANYIIYKALMAFNFPIDDRPNKRQHYCVDLLKTYFPKTIGEMYTRNFEENELFEDVSNIFRNLKKSFEENFIGEWLRENLKRNIKQDLSSFSLMQPTRLDIDLNYLNIRNLDFCRKLEEIMRFNSREYLDRLKKYSRPTHSLESFDTSFAGIALERFILMGYGLMQPPFYHKSFANSLKYSVIGQRIAKELVRLVDESFWNEGASNVPRHDESTKEAHRERIECFRKQYSNYLYNSPDVFQNASMLRDIIGDIVGLKIAFNAYLNWLERDDVTNLRILRKETLSDVNFTNTQLFFINFAQSYCFGTKNEKPVPHFAPYETHSHEIYLVNGPLTNFDEFAREFSCQPGTDMNIDDKCVIY